MILLKRIKTITESVYKWFFKVKYNTHEFRKFKGFITAFYDDYFEPEFTYSHFRITKCRIYTFPKSILIEIHSLSPGMIIGPKGAHIDALKTYMQSRYSKSVNIDLKETNPFK